MRRYERRLCLSFQYVLRDSLLRGNQLPGRRYLWQRCLQHAESASLFECLRAKRRWLCSLRAWDLPVLRYSASEVRFSRHLAELRRACLYRILRDLHVLGDQCDLHERQHAAVGKVLQRHRRHLQGLLQRQHRGLHLP